MVRAVLNAPPRRQRRRAGTRARATLRNWAVCAAAAFVLGGCDESFTPIEPSDLLFSVFGYLDASTDTQWIRVMPVRPLVLTPQGPLGATVTIENLETQRVVELRDSAFVYDPNPDVGSEGVFLHNYWTTEPIEPGATYRFTATRDDGGGAEATVQIPPAYEVEMWMTQRADGNLLQLVGLRHVGLVAVLSYIVDGCGAAVMRGFVDLQPSESDTQSVRLLAPSPSREWQGCGPPRIQKQEVWSVGSGAEWPSGPEYSTNALGVPDAPSNISDAIGFLGGVLTRVVPYEQCQIAGSDRPHYCVLQYDRPLGTIRGTVVDLRCGTIVDEAQVVLRELGVPQSMAPRIRTTRTNIAGGYEVAALRTGIRHELTIGRSTGPPPEHFVDHVDTLEFAAGEEVSHDVGLRRAECPE
jgi:hypothetical protein